ncbi:MAG: FAD:protein FMN transferase [Bacteroidales bacterium]|nr:FAD:protein FMN transferase [Bacteroidales bacterium]
MKKNLARTILVFFAIIIGIYIGKDIFRGHYMNVEGFTQGTTYHITYQSKTGKNLKKDIEEVLAGFDLSLSAYIPNSIISRINTNDPEVRADVYFLTVYNKALEVYNATDGAFDITVAPLVNAWGFGFTEKAEVDSALIDSLVQYVGMQKIDLDGKKIIKVNPNVMIDVNAIAQGYSVDIIARYLDALNIKNYLVEIGGEVKAKGKNKKGKYWRIGVDKPIENNLVPGSDLQTILVLKNQSLATSGNYRKFYEKDGIKYAHSIDPKTGYPVLKNLLSATVITPDCITADAYATAFMVMGLEKTKVFLEKNKKIEAYLIYSDQEGNFQVYCTPGIKKNIKPV